MSLIIQLNSDAIDSKKCVLQYVLCIFCTMFKVVYNTIDLDVVLRNLTKLVSLIRIKIKTQQRFFQCYDSRINCHNNQLELVRFVVALDPSPVVPVLGALEGRDQPVPTKHECLVGPWGRV